MNTKTKIKIFPEYVLNKIERKISLSKYQEK